MAKVLTPNRTRSLHHSPSRNTPKLNLESSPVRPQSAYSISSTIRPVPPSPNSFDEALKNDLVITSTPPMPKNQKLDIVHPNRNEMNSSTKGLRFGAGGLDNNPRHPYQSPLRRGAGGRASPDKRSRPQHHRNDTYQRDLDRGRPLSGPSADQIRRFVEGDGCPTTPTPMSTSQRNSQYTPLNLMGPSTFVPDEKDVEFFKRHSQYAPMGPKKSVHALPGPPPSTNNLTAATTKTSDNLDWFSTHPFTISLNHDRIEVLHKATNFDSGSFSGPGPTIREGPGGTGNIDKVEYRQSVQQVEDDQEREKRRLSVGTFLMGEADAGIEVGGKKGKKIGGCCGCVVM